MSDLVLFAGTLSELDSFRYVLSEVIRFRCALSEIVSFRCTLGGVNRLIIGTLLWAHAAFVGRSHWQHSAQCQLWVTRVIRRLHSRPPRQTCGLTPAQQQGLARWDFVSSLSKVCIFRCVLSEVGRFRCQISEVHSFVMSRIVKFSLLVLEVRWVASLCLK